LAFAAVAGVVWWYRAGREASPAVPQAVSVPQRLASAHTALAQGNFRTALFDLDAVVAPDRRLSLAQRRNVVRLRRQAALLVDLSDVPLEAIIRHAREVSPDEWQLVFPRRYQGRAILFDAEVTRTATGRYEIDYALQVGNQTGRVALGDLDLVRQLGKQTHLDQPTRLIVGGRLGGVAQDPAGTWVISLLAESGVLMTDRVAVVAACPGLADDAELEELLKRQRAWLAELP
jgi:hypothetical protein